MTSTATHTLHSPLQRGETLITVVDVRRPASGELRGISLVKLAELDANTLAVVLPRVTSPTLTKPDIDRLDPADLFALGVYAAGFLAPKNVLEDALVIQAG